MVYFIFQILRQETIQLSKCHLNVKSIFLYQCIFIVFDNASNFWVLSFSHVTLSFAIFHILLFAIDVLSVFANRPILTYICFLSIHVLNSISIKRLEYSCYKNKTFIHYLIRQQRLEIVEVHIFFVQMQWLVKDYSLSQCKSIAIIMSSLQMK